MIVKDSQKSSKIVKVLQWFCVHEVQCRALLIEISRNVTIIHDQISASTAFPCSSIHDRRAAASPLPISILKRASEKS